MIFDSNALIAYLEDETGAELVDGLLKDDDNACVVHAVNLCEAYYITRRDHGEEAAQAALAVLRGARLSIQRDMDDEFCQDAGRIKADYRRVSLADCFCAALANRLNGEVVTADRHEFEPLADAKVCLVRFIR